MKCEKCNAKLSRKDKFCQECGTKVEKEHETKKHSSKTLVWVLIVIGIVLLISAIIVFAVPFPYAATEAYIEKGPYEAEEKYSEKTPYTDYETTSESIPYTAEECSTLNFQYTKTKEEDVIEGGKCTAEKKGPNPDCWVAVNIFIKNLDSKGGDFYVKCTYSNGEVYRTKSQRIEPLSEEYVQCLNNYDFGETLYLSRTEVVPPTKQECETVTKYKTQSGQKEVTKYEDVTKTRTVTKYRDEEKTRTVTKYAPLFQQWTGKVKWYYKVDG